jgi:hypothetical protein
MGLQGNGLVGQVETSSEMQFHFFVVVPRCLNFGGSKGFIVL